MWFSTISGAHRPSRPSCLYSRGRRDRAKLLSWVQIGAITGPTISLPSAALRQANLHFLGSGQGSVSPAGILSTLPKLAAEIDKGTFSIDAVVRPLADVESIWTAPPSGPTERVVLVPPALTSKNRPVVMLITAGRPSAPGS